MTRLKLAFIGGGLDSVIGTTHKIAAQMDDRFSLVAGCFSIDKEMNEQTAKQWHAERVYSNWKELLEGEKNKIDAVVVLTPTSQHTEIVVEAIKAGYPIICEKALTASVSDALNIRKALKKHNGYLAVTYNYNGYPMVRELRSMIRQNKLGRIQQIHIEMPQEGFSRLDKKGDPMLPQQWRLQDGGIPTVSLDLGVHLHSKIGFLTGESPLEVIAVQNSFGFFKQVADNIICIAKYTNNLVCNIWYSKTALGYRNGLRIRVYGEKSSAEWYQMDPERLYLNDNKGHTRVVERGDVDVVIPSEARYNRFKAGHPAGFIEAFANLYYDIADSLTAYRENSNYKSKHVFGINEAVEGLCMLDAIARSAKSNSWERVKGEANNET
ncbi:MAG: Gfo/Idh/MocA family oxidoreductase [Candidatus Saganbacteria bacterium]|nr:Gfo/Idh/MocA family oxidoreductase [Candidatus Saganbacteria bacterium]